ncbi:LacI family DNA-binding transcriptional regulator [Ferruginibacter sp. HRS2-29]|uniref:LacI family DNA-binding transcriptional regulator n=1 Tax=Ferruginibacter sp. HRS2-29 TaxID=2487334 RepID=UPI0020CC87CE|nr:LacI family DNA-binding transcriptional regulator [Ferruginibacter sp. HRS2-29]MCP9750194.1 LacI family transcriptional regulator [Ferruginibacter sp. HRS2-29]
MKKTLPTIKEIAKQLNISISTVSRALHDHPSIGLRTKTRVQELAKQLQYEPNQTAIFFQQGKTFTIGVILPELSEAFFSSAISGIEDAAHKSGYTVLLGQSHDSVDKEKQLIETMKKHRVDGLLISISKNTNNYEHFEALQRYNIPIVFFDRIPKIPNIHYVACNMINGTVQAINFLLKKGHRIIGMINGPEKLPATKERLDGYIQAMIKSRLKYDAGLVLNSDLTKESVCAATEKLLTGKRKPTAIVTFNDYVAMDAVQQARKMKLKINKDICFVSYANLPISHYTAYPPMASVEQFPYQQGQKATETLIDLLQRKTNADNEAINTTYYKIILESQLVIHEGV